MSEDSTMESPRYLPDCTVEGCTFEVYVSNGENCHEHREEDDAAE